MWSSYPIVKIISTLSTIFWLFPPLRQYKGKYFFYFLILALEDIVAYFLIIALKYNYLQVYNIVNILLLCSLIDKKIIKKYWYMIVFTTLLFLEINSLPNYKIIISSMIVIHLIILYIFFKTTAIEYNKRNYLNTGHFVLILYEITILLKFLILLGSFAKGEVFFYLTTAFEIMVAIFFTVYKVEESPAIKLNLFSANK